MEEYRDNILATEAEMKKCLVGEYIVSPGHEALIIHSKVMDCNPHSKIKFVGKQSERKVFGNKTVIFVPSSVTEKVSLEGVTGEIILDIRSLDLEGSKVFHIFNDFLGDFGCPATSADGKKGKVYCSNVEPFVSNAPIQGVKLKKWKVTVILDRYTLKTLDEYCTMFLAFVYRNYKVIGTPHHMSRYIYKTVRFNDGDKKISFALPVLKLSF